MQNEKVELERSLEREQESIVSKLMRKIERLEAETLGKQQHLETIRREKVELENTLEQEQEALVNKLWKKMERLEAEKRLALFIHNSYKRRTKKNSIILEKLFINCRIFKQSNDLHIMLEMKYLTTIYISTFIIFTG